MKYLFFLIILIFNFSLFKAQKTTSSIYDEFIDEHQKGHWKGYVWYMPPDRSRLVTGADISKPMQMIIDPCGITIDKLPYTIAVLDLRLYCDYDNNMPCGVSQFITLHGQSFKMFEKESVEFLGKTYVTNPGTQCFVLEIMEKNIQAPHLICVYIAAQVENVKFALRNAYQEKIIETPVENLMLNVQYGEEFDFKYTKDKYFTYDVKAFAKPNQLLDSTMTPLIKYSEISDLYGVACKIRTDNVSVPPHLNVDDERCCIALMHGDDKWTMCSTVKYDCITPIRRLARFMILECDKTLVPKLSPLNDQCTEQQKKDFWADFIDNSDIGMWAGWGFYSALPTINDQYEVPVWILLQDGILRLFKKKNADAYRAMQINGFNWNVCAGFEKNQQVCHVDDCAQICECNDKLTLVAQARDVMHNLSIQKDRQCIIFEEKLTIMRAILCLFNGNQMPAFEIAIASTRAKSNQVAGWGNDDPDANNLPDNAVLLLAVTDGEIYYHERVQFQKDQVVLYDSQAKIFEYDKLDLIEHQPCKVLTENLIVPEEIRHNAINVGCCLSISYLNRWWYLCSIEEGCLRAKVRMARRITTKCQQTRYPYQNENSPNLNFNGDLVDHHEAGSWAGYVHYSKIGSPTPKRPQYLKISTDGVFITQEARQIDNIDKHEDKFDILSMEWFCAGELPCSVEEYLARKKQKNLINYMKEVFREINLDSTLHCLALEFRTTAYTLSERELILVCPYERAQVQNIKKAFKIAYDHLVLNVNPDLLPFAPEGGEYDVNLYEKKLGFVGSTLPMNEVVNTRIRLNPDSIWKLPEEEPFFKYSEFQPMHNTKCGIEFRDIILPDALKQINMDPQCCFRFNYNQDNVVICTFEKVRCVQSSRMIMKRVKADCIRTLAEIGTATQQEADLYMEKIEFSGKAGIVVEAPMSDDVWLKVNYLDGQWAGKVHYALLKKNKIVIDKKEGFFKLNRRTVILSESPEAVDSGNYQLYNIFQLYFECNIPDLCPVKSYIASQKRYQNIYAQEALEKQIDYFLAELENLKDSSCFILEFEDPFSHTRKSFIMCTHDPIQGPLLRQLLSDTYKKELLNLNLMKDSDTKYVPNTSIKDENIILLYDMDGEIAYNDLPVVPMDKGLKRLTNDAYILIYKEVDGCKVDRDISSLQINPDDIHQVPEQCCFHMKRYGKVLVICSQDEFRCLRGKSMLMKQIVNQCEGKDVKLDFMKRVRQSDIREEFMWGMPRRGNNFPKTFDTQTLKKYQLDNNQNGQWQGYVYANIMTEREFKKPLQAFYLDVSKKGITFKKNKESNNIISYYATKYLIFGCDESPVACTPSQYLKIYKEKNGFYAQQELGDSMLSFLENLPVVDETGCLVIEHEEPNARSISSDVMCTLYSEDGNNLRLALAAAYYQATIHSSVLEDIPLVCFETETFELHLHEENKISTETIKFDEVGIVKDSSIYQIIYTYEGVAPDKHGNNCGFWYKRLDLPEKLKELQVDSNCCFTFYLKNGNQVHICSTHQFRCITPVRKVLKRLLYGCLQANSERVPNPYESANTLPSTEESDLYEKVLYDNHESGVWKGNAFIHQIGKDDMDIDAARYLIIDNGFIKVIDQPPIEPDLGVPYITLISRNQRFMCLQQDGTCSLSGYQDYYKNHVSAQPIDLDILKADLKLITEKLPASVDKDHCCTVISVINTLKKQDQYVICTRVEKQGDNIKKALTLDYQNIISKSNITTEIPLPQSKETFNIVVYNPTKEVIKRHEIAFGNQYMYDTVSGEKLLKYTEIFPDKFLQPCAIWYKDQFVFCEKHLFKITLIIYFQRQITLPPLLAQVVNLKTCCFMMIVNSVPTYICAEAGFHCLLPQRQMIRTLRAGCLAKNDGLNLNDPDLNQIPEEKNPNSDVYGEPYESSLNVTHPNKDGIPEFFHHGQDPVETQPNEGIFKAWMLYTVLPNNKAEVLDPTEVQLDISPSSFRIISDTNVLLEDINPVRLNFQCSSKLNQCSPTEMIDALKKQGGEANSDIQLMQIAWEKTQEINGLNEKKCIAIEYYRTVASVVTQKRILCVIFDSPEMVDNMNAAINRAYKISYDFIQYADIKLPPLNQKYAIEYIPPGSKHSQNVQIGMTKQGLEFNDHLLIQYLEMDHCNLCYGVQDDVLQSIHTQKDCCIEFQKQGQYGYICVQEQYRCETHSRQLTKMIYESCITLNMEIISKQPGYCLIVHSKEMPMNTDFQTVLNKVQMEPPSMLRFAEKNAQDIVDIKIIKKEIYDNLLELNRRLNFINKEPMYKEIQDGQEYTYNQDGSVTMDRPDGVQVISDSFNNQTVLIEKDNSIQIVLDDGTKFHQSVTGLYNIELKSGETIKSYEDGTFEISKQGNNIKVFKNNTAILTKKNQEQTIVYQDDSADSILEDGTKVIRYTDGNTEVDYHNQSNLIKSPDLKFQFKELEQDDDTDNEIDDNYDKIKSIRFFQLRALCRKVKRQFLRFQKKKIFKLLKSY